MAQNTPLSRDRSDKAVPSFDRIARRIGQELREMYRRPEADPLPAEHVQLLLRLRHKERDRLRETIA